MPLVLNNNMSSSTTILITTAIITFVIYCGQLSIQKLNYWRQKKIPQDEIHQIFVTMIQTMCGFRSYGDVWREYYNRHKRFRYYGDYQLLSPVLFLHDSELIKNILVKDFACFTDRRDFVYSESDPVFANGIFGLKGDRWRKLRTDLSPSYTSAKLRQMFELINTTAINHVKHYKTIYKNQCEPILQVECQDAFKRFANDTIVNCAFGVECDSMRNPENDIYKMGLKTQPSGIIRSLKILIALNLPQLAKYINCYFFPPEVRHFFLELVTATVKHRETFNVHRVDLLDGLMKTNNQSGKFDNATILSQALVLYVGGFDTISTALSFCCYELSLNPQIQQKLYEEIARNISINKMIVNHDVINNMTYLDMVVSETLRKWPPALLIGRCCTKHYIIPPLQINNDEIDVGVRLNPGDKILISVLGVHRDGEIYPDPDRFDPARFTEGNKKKRSPTSYLPFGLGPRGCIATRFAMMEMKILLVHLLLNFELVTIDKTRIPMELGKTHINLAPVKDVWLGFQRR